MDVREKDATSLRKKSYIFYKFHSKCAYCGKELCLASMTIDHMQPRTKNGTNDLANLLSSCRQCNSSKGTKTLEEFRLYLSRKAIGMPVFNDKQMQWLKKNYCLIHIRINLIKFWFENNNIHIMEKEHGLY